MVKRGTLGSVIFLMFLLAFIGQLRGQPYSVRATVDTNRIQIGDQIHLDYTVNQPETARVAFPSMEQRFSQDIELIRAYPRDTLESKSSGMIRVRQRLLITSFDSGAVEIPSMAFKYRHQQGVDSIVSPPVSLFVETVRVDTTRSIFGIKGPLGAPLSFAELLPYLLAALALAGLIWAGIYLWKRRKKHQPAAETPSKPDEPAHVYAFRELDRLKEQRLWQNGQVKLYYTRLTEILRTYLWMRYDIKTLERTTDEILLSLQNSELNDQQAYDQLSTILKTADLVKFARMEPAPGENESHLESAYAFVRATRYVEQAGGQETEGDQPENGENVNVKSEQQTQ